ALRSPDPRVVAVQIRNGPGGAGRSLHRLRSGKRLGHRRRRSQPARPDRHVGLRRRPGSLAEIRRRGAGRVLPQRRSRSEAAPARTWGTATFDSARSLILYWGGGHCGYGGSDVDAYDVAAHTWRSGADAPEYPERSWDMGVRLAGVTFQGNPWTEHGRKIYAFDPVSSRMIMVRPIRLTTGYDPAPPARFPAWRAAAKDALVTVPTSYLRYATWRYDPATARREIVAPAPVGLDTIVTTRRGVMGVHVHWQTRLNDAGYILPWSPRQAPADTALYLFRSDLGRWERLSGPGASPQNLYEMTSLAYDSRRDGSSCTAPGSGRTSCGRSI